MQVVVISIYALTLGYIFLFSMGQLHLTWIYTRIRKAKVNDPVLTQIPLVTIQLPIYNEKYVVERLIEAVANFDYPKEKLEIQILDDSTDETTALILRKIESLRHLNLTIHLIHRENRAGYKAGALAHGFQLATGEFIAIFDADFVPSPDFLQKTLPYFQNKQVGVVQTRWGHINKDYSLLTRLQAFGLDAHFSIEQSARSAAGSFINFNGTCGVWRKTCIADAGGWSFDTLTEDLDLSYRAQLKGWRFHYLEEVETKGELPIIMSAIKSQQYRWNKGAAETARKNFGSVLASHFSLKNKVHGFFHLFNSSVFICLLMAGLLSIPMLYIKQARPNIAWLFNLGIIFLAGFLSITLFYWVATKRFNPLNQKKIFWSLYPRFLIVSMGLSLHNGLAVLEGLIGRKTPFVRTPKFNVQHRSDSWKSNVYIQSNIKGLTIGEAMLCLYFVFGIVAGIQLKDYGLLFFHAMMALGFGSVFYYSMKSTVHGS
ncbi:MAG: glycosyltransferase [Cyclobacteriaceae bacterium]|jgi:cellulose synthase/poly-beta-1,6-N-acetylglucosamine synthase-like glycosyltransferase|nr:glycosyltransferase [Flammeovirgaceae bacterium]